MVWEYKDWYAENKATLLKKRKIRYRQDRAYRESVKRQANERYKILKKERRPVDRLSIRDDGGVHFITIGKLAQMIGRKPQTLRVYHINKIFPACSNYDSRGWRLYSPQQAITIRRAFSKFDAGELSSLEEVKSEIIKNWSD